MKKDLNYNILIDDSGFSSIDNLEEFKEAVENSGLDMEHDVVQITHKDSFLTQEMDLGTDFGGSVEEFYDAFGGRPIEDYDIVVVDRNKKLNKNDLSEDEKRRLLEENPDIELVDDGDKTRVQLKEEKDNNEVKYFTSGFLKSTLDFYKSKLKEYQDANVDDKNILNFIKDKIQEVQRMIDKNENPQKQDTNSVNKKKGIESFMSKLLNN